MVGEGTTAAGSAGLNPATTNIITSGRLDGAFEVGPDMYVVRVNYGDLREQDVNAHTMPPSKFERLVENIRLRGTVESLPYCWSPSEDAPIEIISGHHRVRAAIAAGIHEGPILLDTASVPRATMVAKQIAHNALVGVDDSDLIRTLLAEIDDPDARLSTGLPADILEGKPEVDVASMFAPRIDFDYRTVSFAFLPHQQAELERLIDMLDGRQDLVVVAPIEQFDEFLKVAARYARLKQVRSGATAITLMVRLALAEIEEAEKEGDDASAE